MPSKKIGLFSFFSGAGLLDLALENNGFEILWVNEYFEPFLDMYKFSRKKMEIPEPRFGYSKDSIADIITNNKKMKELKENIQTSKNDNFLIGFVGGPPCPDFSIGGKNRGHLGENGKLSKTYINIILQQMPDFFIFENVKGLFKTKKHREFFDSLMKDVKKAGYGVTYRVLNALEYGAPQDRERVFVVGFRNISSTEIEKNFPWENFKKYDIKKIKEIAWPQTTEFKQMSLRAAPKGIVKELTVEYWFEKNKVGKHPNSLDAFTPRQAKERFKIIPEGDDSKKSFKRLHRWRYSPTVAYGNNEVHLHPYKARRLSAAEALSLQSMPKKFELPAHITLSAKFKTIGNGVPYLLGSGLAETIKGFLKGVHNEFNRK